MEKPLYFGFRRSTPRRDKIENQSPSGRMRSPSLDFGERVRDEALSRRRTLSFSLEGVSDLLDRQPMVFQSHIRDLENVKASKKVVGVQTPKRGRVRKKVNKPIEDSTKSEEILYDEKAEYSDDHKKKAAKAKPSILAGPSETATQTGGRFPSGNRMSPEISRLREEAARIEQRRVRKHASKLKHYSPAHKSDRNFIEENKRVGVTSRFLSMRRAMAEVKHAHGSSPAAAEARASTDTHAPRSPARDVGTTNSARELRKVQAIGLMPYAQASTSVADPHRKLAASMTSSLVSSYVGTPPLSVVSAPHAVEHRVSFGGSQLAKEMEAVPSISEKSSTEQTPQEALMKEDILPAAHGDTLASSSALASSSRPAGTPLRRTELVLESTGGPEPPATPDPRDTRSEVSVELDADKRRRMQASVRAHIVRDATGFLRVRFPPLSAPHAVWDQFLLEHRHQRRRRIGAMNILFRDARYKIGTELKALVAAIRRLEEGSVKQQKRAAAIRHRRLVLTGTARVSIDQRGAQMTDTLFRAEQKRSLPRAGEGAGGGSYRSRRQVREDVLGRRRNEARLRLTRRKQEREKLALSLTGGLDLGASLRRASVAIGEPLSSQPNEEDARAAKPGEAVSPTPGPWDGTEFKLLLTRNLIKKKRMHMVMQVLKKNVELVRYRKALADREARDMGQAVVRSAFVGFKLCLSRRREVVAKADLFVRQRREQAAVVALQAWRKYALRRVLVVSLLRRHRRMRDLAAMTQVKARWQLFVVWQRYLDTRASPVARNWSRAVLTRNMFAQWAGFVSQKRAMKALVLTQYSSRVSEVRRSVLLKSRAESVGRLRDMEIERIADSLYELSTQRTAALLFSVSSSRQLSPQRRSILLSARGKHKAVSAMERRRRTRHREEEEAQLSVGAISGLLPAEGNSPQESLARLRALVAQLPVRKIPDSAGLLPAGSEAGLVAFSPRERVRWFHSRDKTRSALLRFYLENMRLAAIAGRTAGENENHPDRLAAAARTHAGRAAATTATLGRSLYNCRALARGFYFWRVRFVVRRRDAAVAAYADRSIQQRVVTVVHRRVLAGRQRRLLVDRLYAVRVLRRYFGRLSAGVSAAQKETEGRCQKALRQVRLPRALKAWQAYVARRRESYVQQGVADANYARLLKRECVIYWLQRTRNEVRLDHISLKIAFNFHSRVVNQSWRHWVKRTRTRRQLRAVFDYAALCYQYQVETPEFMIDQGIKRDAFGGWWAITRDTIARKREIQLDRAVEFFRRFVLLSRHYSRWQAFVALAREKRAERTARQRPVLRRHLRAWRELVAARDKGVRRMCKSRARRQKVDCLLRWKRAHFEERVVRLYTTRKAFRVWAQIIHRQFQMEPAWHNRFILLRRYMRHWRTALEDKTAARRADAHGRAVVLRTRLQSWRAAAATQRKLRVAAAAIEAYKERTRLVRSWRLWLVSVEYHAALRGQYTVAVDYRCSKLLSSGFNSWKQWVQLKTITRKRKVLADRFYLTAVDKWLSGMGSLVSTQSLTSLSLSPDLPSLDPSIQRTVRVYEYRLLLEGIQNWRAKSIARLRVRARETQARDRAFVPEAVRAPAEVASELRAEELGVSLVKNRIAALAGGHNEPGPVRLRKEEVAQDRYFAGRKLHDQHMRRDVFTTWIVATARSIHRRTTLPREPESPSA